MAATYQTPPNLASLAPMQVADMALTVRLRPRPQPIVISEADFSYGEGDIETSGERYITPYNIDGDEKPFFHQYQAPKGIEPPKGILKPSKKAIVVQEREVVPSPPSSTVSSPRTEQPPIRPTVRWKDLSDHKVSESSLKAEKPRRHSTGERDGPERRLSASSASGAPTPRQPRLPDNSLSNLSRPEWTPTQPQQQPSSSSRSPSRRGFDEPDLQTIPECPAGFSYITPPPQPLYYHHSQPHQAYSPPSSPRAYPTNQQSNYDRPSSKQAPSSQQVPSSKQVSSSKQPQQKQSSPKPQERSHAPTYTNRYRPLRDVQPDPRVTFAPHSAPPTYSRSSARDRDR